MAAHDDIRLIQGRPLRLSLRRSVRARHLRVTVSERLGVEVVMPRWATRRDVDRVLDEAEDWVAEQATRHAVWDGPRRRAWASGSELTLLGRSLRLALGPLPPGKSRARVTVTDDALRMDLTPVEILDPRPALERWLRREAGDHLRERTQALAERTALVPQRVIVGERTSRWGSCSTRGTISYCYRLVMAPPEVVDAVVIHELAHLPHPNHGPRWRALVHRHCPDHDKQMAWLQEHGGTLQL